MISSIEIIFFKILLILNYGTQSLTFSNYGTIQCSHASLLPKCIHLSNYKLECTNFTNFNELNLNQCSTLQPFYNYVKLKPNVPIILDKQLDLSYLNFDSKRFQFILENINGFEITFNPFTSNTLTSTSNLTSQFHYLSVAKSDFKFFYRNNTFDWICDLVMNADTSLKPLFAEFRIIYLGGTDQHDQIYYTHRLCPIIFKGARIESLYFFNITLQNRPEFLQFNQSDLINSVIKNVHIQSSIVKLDNIFFDKNVFKSVEKLSIEFSYLVVIKSDFFKSFRFLKQINLWLFNLRQFLRSPFSENSWMHYINIENKMKQVFIEFNDEKDEYDYPERDFCLFKHFPHGNNVFPILKSSNRMRYLNCTCTIVWLMRQWHMAEKNIRTELISSCFRSSKTETSSYDDSEFSHYFQGLVRQCNLEKRIKKCFVKPTHRHSLTELLLASAVRGKTNATKVYLFSIVILKFYFYFLY